MEQRSGLSSGQKPLVVALFGGLIVAGIWFAVSMSIATTIIFGIPIGAMLALIIHRTISRMSRKSPPSIGSQSSPNGTEPAPKKREDARAASPVKLK